ncbi:MAG: hypothetical protein IJX93_03640 [Clostridia bacterium]|nr:hypothetical protein [Clostridia bacterium]MBQ8513577.1 hypothetical protein [Clostridia bacterium]
MKKLTALLLAFLLLVSCGNGGLPVITEEDIAAGLNKYADKNVHLDYLPEAVYSFDGTDMPTDFKDGIFSDSSKALLNGRLYFNVPVTFNSDMSSADFSPAYVNLETGNLIFYCPDPLCTHDDDSECRFKGISGSVFYNDDTVFASRYVYGSPIESQIIRITMSTAEIEVIYRCSPDDSVGDLWDSVNIDGIEGDSLYLYTMRNTESGDRQIVQQYQSWRYDIPTQKMTEVGEISEERVLHTNHEPPRMPEILAETFGEDGIADWFETAQYVYFTKYDPVKLGQVTREDGKTFGVEYSHGGKIYRIPKAGGEEELIFDGKDEIYIKEWLVVGNHLYLLLNELVLSGGQYHFRGAAGSMGIIRVNMTDHTMKYLTKPQ